MDGELRLPRADLEQTDHLVDHVDERQRLERVGDVTDGQLLEVANQFVGATDVGVDELGGFPDIGELGGGSVARRHLTIPRTSAVDDLAAVLSLISCDLV
jgi:hypothetical protein